MSNKTGRDLHKKLVKIFERYTPYCDDSHAECAMRIVKFLIKRYRKDRVGFRIVLFRFIDGTKTERVIDLMKKGRWAKMIDELNDVHRCYTFQKMQEERPKHASDTPSLNDEVIDADRHNSHALDMSLVENMFRTNVKISCDK